MIEAIVWTVIAGIGAIAGLVLIVEAVRDRAAAREAQRADPNAAVRDLLARVAVRTELLRMVTQGMFLIVGTIAIAFLSSGRLPPVWFGKLVSWGLIIGSAAVSTNSVLNVFARRKVDALLAGGKP